MGNYRNDIIFQELLTLVADIEKQHILYQKNRLYVWEIIGIFLSVSMSGCGHHPQLQVK